MIARLLSNLKLNLMKYRLVAEGTFIMVASLIIIEALFAILKTTNEKHTAFYSLLKFF
jgi:hypothetical protein